jgi:hypothetical protein
MQTINFKGPYDFLPSGENFFFDQEDAKTSGIYLWAVKDKDESYFINYVGISAQSIWARHSTHLTYYLSGNYRIIDPKELLRKKFKVIYQPNADWKPYLSNYFNLSKTTLELLKIIKIFYATLVLDKRTLERIETSLIKHIRNNYEDTYAKVLDNTRICYLRPDEKELQFRIETPVPIKIPEIITC